MSFLADSFLYKVLLIQNFVGIKISAVEIKNDD